MITLSYAGLRGQGLAGNAAVEQLQTALNALAKTTGNTSLQVHVDGSMGPQTVSATVTALGTIAGSLDPSIQAIMTVLPFLVSTGDENKAEKTITEHASAITAGILGYIAAKGIQAANGPTTVNQGTGVFKSLNLRFPQILATYAGNAPQTSPKAAAAGNSLIYAFDSKINLYRLAMPIGVSGKAAYAEVGTSANKPTVGTEVPLKQFLVALGILPWYETWWGMSVIGVGLVGALGGAFVLMKRKVPKQFQGALGREDSYHRRGYGHYGFRRFNRV